MKIAIPRERRDQEHRVAASPETVRKFVAAGVQVVIETGAGLDAGFSDHAFTEAGASVADTAAGALGDADLVLKVQRPLLACEGGTDEVSLMREGAVLISQLDPTGHPEQAEAFSARKITAFSMELMPRISRAQSMDVLSSQANLAGYRAVLDAAYEFGRAFPMMMTAAGTVAPARVLVIGVGVAGLQAIATAKRLGAIVSATDVRSETEEQVRSLGAKFIKPDFAESGDGDGGYARQMSPEFLDAQAELVHNTLMKQDIVICSALVNGRRAPTLVTEAMVADMRPGSIVVDLAVEQGGNCPLSKPGEIVMFNGVKILGHLNVPSRIATSSAPLYAKNLLNFLLPHINAPSGELAFDWDDETVEGTLMMRDGEIVNPIWRNGAA